MFPEYNENEHLIEKLSGKKNYLEEYGLKLWCKISF